MKFCLKSIYLFDKFSIFLKQKLINLIDLFNFLDLLNLFSIMAALIYFLNYPCDFIIEVWLLELMSSICVAVWNILLVNRSLWEMIDGDIFMSWEEKIFLFYCMPFKWLSRFWKIVSKSFDALIWMFRRGVIESWLKIIFVFLNYFALLKLFAISIFLIIFILTLFLVWYILIIVITFFNTFDVDLQSPIH